ncbi:hypothetical protein CAPTEDRAFT_221866 [Capitella teleta]|uniref:Uncharacterized protein n=1 Tax=Capitella teleta TaxID=283909 RepID=R7TTG3_CAPTE|nr:hypothetical protein CAPTEDRAFT_221866 [Capitella teleta]|eukprot:ELT96959.1 hypothetical protein CAPTEDRAFT_221866 [Capitella teleta]
MWTKLNAVNAFCLYIIYYLEGYIGIPCIQSPLNSIVMATSREAFVHCIEQNDRSAFLSFINQHNNKNDDFSLDEMLTVNSQRQMEELWASVHVMCSTALLGFTAEDCDSVMMLEDAKHLLQTMGGVVTMATLLIQQDCLPPMLYDTVYLLNGMLLHFGSQGLQLQRQVASISELWWLKDLPNRDDMASNLMAFLLHNVMSANGKGAVKDVKSLWKLRSCLKHVSLDDAAIVDLLKQAFSCSILLSRDEGRKFLSEVFLLRVDLIAEFHSLILMQLSHATKEKIGWYGAIYVRAWRESKGDFKQTIESLAIQRLMHLAVHCKRRIHGSRISPASTARKLLNAFHRQKLLDGMDEMLFRLYSPILWRSLRAANADVRANATAVLLDAFPLQDPEAQRAKDKHASHQRQFDILKELLFDPSPEVRCLAVEGVCRICNVYWELIPIATICSFLGNLVDDLIWDVSSDDVRCSVVKGLTHLLDNHLSHAILANLLPKIRNSFHDKCDRVRLAFVALLDKLKTIKAIKYWHVIPMDHLLGRLAVENPRIGRSLSAMLLPTFLPLDKDPTDQLTRCLTLWRENSSAARAFYSHAYKIVSVQNTAKFMISICNLLLITVAQHRKKAGTKSTDDTLMDSQLQEKENSSQEEEDIEDDEDDLKLTDTEAVAGFLETLVILRVGIASTLSKPENQKIATKIQEKLSIVVCKIFPETYTQRMTNAVISLAGLVPSKMVPMVSSKAMSRLRKYTADDDEDGWRLLLDNTLNWNKWNESLDLIEEWLRPALLTVTKEPTSAGRVGFADDTNSQPAMAVEYFSYILSKPLARQVLLKPEKIDRVKSIVDILSNIKVLIEKKISDEELDSVMTDDFIVKVFNLYLTAEMFLNGEDFSEILSDLLRWVEVTLVGALTPKANKPKKKKHRKLLGAMETTLLGEPDSNVTAVDELSTTLMNNTLLSETLAPKNRDGVEELLVQLIKSVVFVGWNSMATGVVDLPMTTTLCMLALSVVKLDDRLIPEVMTLLRYAVTSSLIGHRNLSSEGLGADLHFIPNSLAECFQLLSKLAQMRNQEQLQLILKSIKSEFYEMLNEYYTWYDTYENEVKLQPIKECVTAVTMEMSSAVAKDCGMAACENVVSLMPLSAFIVSFFCKKASLLQIFLDYLARELQFDEIAEIESFVALLHVIHALMPQFSSSKWLHNGGDIFTSFQEISSKMKSKLQALATQDHNETLKQILTSADKMVAEIDSRMESPPVSDLDH